jgi:glycosyltransferase involved in cell wall biosynthesis
MTKISIIISCYYNEKNIPVTVKELIANERNFQDNVCFEYVFVDDGSGDQTFAELLKFREAFPEKVKIVKLSGNFGSHNAALAGMLHATGDCNVIMAADLQDPPELIPEMLNHWKNGIKLVVASRIDRKDPYISKKMASLFHSLIRKYALDNLPEGGFDFILFDRQLKEDILRINEKNTNIMYLLLWLKYPFVTVPYVRRERKIGKSRWTIKKKMKLFIDSFVAFSFLPIRLISLSGFLLGLIAITYALFILYNKITGNIEVRGWSTIMVVFLMVSSFNMISIGIIGEYLWRTLDASRNRPNYVIDKIIQ